MADLVVSSSLIETVAEKVASAERVLRHPDSNIWASRSGVELESDVVAADFRQSVRLRDARIGAVADALAALSKNTDAAATELKRVDLSLSKHAPVL